MKRLPEILAFLKNYKLATFLNVIFNLLMTIFSIFTLFSIVPFLKVLFQMNSEEMPTTEPEISMDSEALLDYVNFHLVNFIELYGPSNALAIICGGVVVMTFFKSLTRYLAMYNLAHIRTGVVRDMREKVYRKILRLPLSYYSKERKGDLMTRLSSDVFEVEWSIMGSLEMLFRDPLIIALNLSFLFIMSWKLTLLALILLPVSGLAISIVGKSLKRSARKGQNQLGTVMSHIEETLTGLRILKAFNAEEKVDRHFAIENNRLANLMRKLYRKQYMASPLTELFAIMAVAIILWYGGSVILSGDSAFDGAFFIFYLLTFSQLIVPAKSLSDAYFRIQKGLASLDRINEIMDADLKITDKPNAQKLDTFAGEIEFRNVSFRYESELVLKDINFTIKKGQTVALVGPSGGGKSTLADLLPRFYDLAEGEILLDGVNIKEYSLHSLRAQMGIVSQKPILFNDTVANNIALSAKETNLEAVKEAARIGHVDEFVDALDNGYETTIGEGGDRLSGGQQQRLSIARAVLKNPPILILDEATSALDTESEKLVQDALTHLMANRTSLVIAHRLSTIQHADQILVVKDGTIHERGTHDELLAREGMYHKLTQLQSLD